MRGDLGEVGLDLLAQVTDHDDDVLRLQRGGGVDGVAEHRVAGDLVQQLGARGLHPLALAGRQDDDGGDRARRRVWVGVDGYGHAGSSSTRLSDAPLPG